MNRFVVALTLTSLAGCGGSPSPAKSQNAAAKDTHAAAPAETADESAEHPAADDETAGPVALPTTCADGSSSPCLMPRAFVKRMCSNAYPELALMFFAKESPWTRAYVAVRQAEPFNGQGGPSSDMPLLFEEEVLVVAARMPNLGGMSVSGVGASYDLLRWDGTCATLSEGEVRFQRPPKPGHADINWRRLDESTQNALMADDQIRKWSEERRKECKGVTIGAVSAKCEKADRALKDRVVTAVRAGLAVPKPSNLP